VCLTPNEHDRTRGGVHFYIKAPNRLKKIRPINSELTNKSSRIDDLVLLQIDDTVHTNWYNWQGTSKSEGVGVSLIERSTAVRAARLYLNTVVNQMNILAGKKSTQQRWQHQQQ
jgi:hypothetical protein